MGISNINICDIIEPQLEHGWCVALFYDNILKAEVEVSLLITKLNY